MSLFYSRDDIFEEDERPLQSFETDDSLSLSLSGDSIVNSLDCSYKGFYLEQELMRVESDMKGFALSRIPSIPARYRIYHASFDERLFTGDLIQKDQPLFFGLEASIALWYLQEMRLKEGIPDEKLMYLYSFLVPVELEYLYINRIRNHPTEVWKAKNNIALHPQLCFHLQEETYHLSYELTIPIPILRRLLRHSRVDTMVVDSDFVENLDSLDQFYHDIRVDNPLESELRSYLSRLNREHFDILDNLNILCPSPLETDLDNMHKPLYTIDDEEDNDEDNEEEDNEDYD